MAVPSMHEERVGWLRSMLSSYRDLYEERGGEAADEDPGSTGDMLREVETLCRQLEKACRDEAAKAEQPAAVAAGSDDTSDIPW